MLEPTLKEKILGRAEVRQLFPVSRLGTNAGCSVIHGYMTRVKRDKLTELRARSEQLQERLNELE